MLRPQRGEAEGGSPWRLLIGVLAIIALTVNAFRNPEQLYISIFFILIGLGFVGFLFNEFRKRGTRHDTLAAEDEGVKSEPTDQPGSIDGEEPRGTI
jgi:hypothetical protein